MFDQIVTHEIQNLQKPKTNTRFVCCALGRYWMDIFDTWSFSILGKTVN